MYTVQWREHEGNRRELQFERSRDANAEARRLSEDYDGVTVKENKPSKPRIPKFLREALETARTVTVNFGDGTWTNGVIIDVDANLGAITLGDVCGGEQFIFTNAISTII